MPQSTDPIDNVEDGTYADESDPSTWDGVGDVNDPTGELGGKYFDDGEEE